MGGNLRVRTHKASLTLLSDLVPCDRPTGRWKRNLIAKCVRAGKPYSDVSVSPVVRQTLQHWGYELTHVSARVRACVFVRRVSTVCSRVLCPNRCVSQADYDEYAPLVRNGAGVPYLRR